MKRYALLLDYFIDDLALERHVAPAIVSEMVIVALGDDLDQWRDRFGNQA
jgi:hypothetical protein